MGAFSPLQFLFLLNFTFPLIPTWRILKKVALSPAWLLLYMPPVIGMMAVWPLLWLRLAGPWSCPWWWCS